MRRGLTLIETLGAIALLGALAAVSAHWITTALRISTETCGRLAWEQAAHRTFELITRDIAIGDEQEVPRARVDDKTLVIKTRIAPTLPIPGGSVERHYVAINKDGATLLVCYIQEPDRASRGSWPIEEERVLLGALTDFKADIVGEEGELSLVVMLVSRHATLTREFAL